LILKGIEVACSDAFLRVFILQDLGKTRKLKRETRKKERNPREEADCAGTTEERTRI
jgi:hypothetical protein